MTNGNQVCVVGLGYIGLPTALLLVEKGFTVAGCDVSPEIIDTLERGECHITEPGVYEYLDSAIKSGRFECSLSPQAADVFIVAVPTPTAEVLGQNGYEKTCDLTFVLSAVESLASVLRPGNCLIIESTCSVGATDKVLALLNKLRPDFNVTEHLIDNGDHLYVAYCPERVLPGRTFAELISNDRVIGGATNEAGQKVKRFYDRFIDGRCLVTNAKTAEMAKLTENAFRDVNIAFANELANICEENGVDVWELRGLANRHPRVDILEPGPGVGGHCIAVDPWFLASAAPASSPLIQCARAVNDRRPSRVVKQVEEVLTKARAADWGKRDDVLTVGLFGMSFKPNIDDFRESPSLEVLKSLKTKDLNIELVVIEPFCKQAHIEGVRVLPTTEALMSVDVAVLLVAHEEFHGKTPRTPYVIDMKNWFSSVNQVSGS